LAIFERIARGTGASTGFQQQQRTIAVAAGVAAAKQTTPAPITIYLGRRVNHYALRQFIITLMASRDLILSFSPFCLLTGLGE